MAAVQGEVGYQHGVDNRSANHHPWVDQETGYHSHAGQHQGDARGDDATWGAVRAMHFRATYAQGDVCGHHQYVGDGGAEHRHQNQQVTLAAQRQGKADQAGHDQRQYRRLVLVGQRQRTRQITSARQGEDLPGVGVDDREEAGDQTGEADQVDEAAHPGRFAVGNGQRFHQRVARGHQRIGARATGADQQDRQGEDQQYQHGADQPARHVALRVASFFCGQWDTFYCEKEPDRIGNRRPHADIAERQEAAGACGLGDRNVEQVGHGEVRHHREDKHAQGNRRHGGDDKHQLQRLTDAEDVDADKQHIEGQVNRPAANAEQRFTVGPDKHRNGGRGDGVLDQDRCAGEKATQWPEGAAGKAIAATCGGDHRGQFSQGEAHAQVHQRHQQGGEKHAAPAALGQAEVPAGVVAGNHVGNAQTDQQHPACCALLQLPALEIIGIDLL
ncbi:hypothetical protein D3C85_940320 [compost metagenome]